MDKFVIDKENANIIELTKRHSFINYLKSD